MADAKDRALNALVAMLAPAAALGVECTMCRAGVGVQCRGPSVPGFGGPIATIAPHEGRRDPAREQLRQHLRTLFEI